MIWVPRRPVLFLSKARGTASRRKPWSARPSLEAAALVSASGALRGQCLIYEVMFIRALPKMSICLRFYLIHGETKAQKDGVTCPDYTASKRSKRDLNPVPAASFRFKSPDGNSFLAPGKVLKKGSPAPLLFY